MPIGTAEQHTSLAHPWQRRKLVHGGDQEGRKPLIERLVHRHDGKRSVAGEVALEVGADDAQFTRLVVVREERE